MNKNYNDAELEDLWRDLVDIPIDEDERLKKVYI